MPPVPLTVGVEWEFLFGYVDGRAPDPWDAFHGSLLHHLGLMQDLFRDQTAYPEERQLAVFRHVARTLQEDAEIGGAFDVVCETALAQQAARSYAAWVVKPDPSLRNPTLHLDSGRGGYYEFEQVELNSPVLPADDDEEEEEGRTTT
ncbi:hypothetical protein VTK73DRAFT_6160 [Phialemonium thermophilum]|uniref:Uncharacterized protein n=1 Tax=Phialemonium thermophilum TaxID=223376 RepID=A0ABR3UZX9_9PEZI